MQVNIRDVQLEHLKYPFGALVFKHFILNLFGSAEYLHSLNSVLLIRLLSSFLVKFLELASKNFKNWSLAKTRQMIRRLQATLNELSYLRYLKFNGFNNSFGNGMG